MLSVKLDDGRLIRAGVDATGRGIAVRFLRGDRVSLRLSSRDPNRGQITKKL